MSFLAAHDRSCQYATVAMETLLAKQKHTDKCPQCRVDPEWCNSASSFDADFRHNYELWAKNRSSGGVVEHVR